MTLQSLDIKQRSATTTPPPGARATLEVAKLIDISKCITLPRNNPSSRSKKRGCSTN